jgi:hypothetical protein
MTREEAKRLLEKMMPQQRSDIKSIPHLMITEALSVAIKALEQQPTRPTGRWIDIDCQSYTWQIKCPFCNHIRSMMSTQGIYPNYCENCGRKMEV